MWIAEWCEEDVPHPPSPQMVIVMRSCSSMAGVCLCVSDLGLALRGCKSTPVYCALQQASLCALNQKVSGKGAADASGLVFSWWCRHTASPQRRSQQTNKRKEMR